MKDVFDPDTKELPRQRKLTEAKIQETCVKFARKHGYWARKFSSPAQRSVPDYLFSKICPGGRHIKLAVEFKAPAKTSTEAQLDEQKAMLDTGWIVWKDVGTNGNKDVVNFKLRLFAFEKESRPAYPG